MSTKIIVLFLLSANITAQAQIGSASLQGQHFFADSIARIASQQWAKDSLTVFSWSDSVKHTINSQLMTHTLGIRHTIDSLQTLQLPTEKLVEKLDSLAQKKDELLSEVTARKDELELKTKSRLQEWQHTVIAKLGLDSLAHGAGLHFPEATLPGMPNELFGLAHPSIQSLGGISLPELPALSAGDFQQLKLSLDLASIQESLPFKNIEGLKHMQEKLRSLSKGVSQVTEFTKNPDKSIDAALANIAPVSDLQEKVSAMEQLPANEFVQQAQQLNNPEALKEEAKQQVLKKAVDHFKGREERLKQAMAKMAQYKQQYTTVNSLSEIPRKSPNEMRGQPFIERLLPGIAFQVRRKNDLSIDFNPYLGYRLTKRLSVGGGWNQRLAFIQWNQTNRNAAIYGPRAFVEMNVWKGFSPRLEVDYLNGPVPLQVINVSSDPGKRAWGFGSNLGMKKEYRLAGKIRGTALVMANLFSPFQGSTARAFQVRFGLEFPLKDAPKKDNLFQPE